VAPTVAVSQQPDADQFELFVLAENWHLMPPASVNDIKDRKDLRRMYCSAVPH
jgi:hypothetical protein